MWSLFFMWHIFFIKNIWSIAKTTYFCLCGLCCGLHFEISTSAAASTSFHTTPVLEATDKPVDPLKGDKSDRIGYNRIG